MAKLRCFSYVIRSAGSPKRVVSIRAISGKIFLNMSKISYFSFFNFLFFLNLKWREGLKSELLETRFTADSIQFRMLNFRRFVCGLDSVFLRNKFCCSSSDLKFDKGVNIFSVSLLLKYFPLMPLVLVASWKSTNYARWPSRSSLQNRRYFFWHFVGALRANQRSNLTCKQDHCLLHNLLTLKCFLCRLS